MIALSNKVTSFNYPLLPAGNSIVGRSICGMMKLYVMKFSENYYFAKTPNRDIRY